MTVAHPLDARHGIVSKWYRRGLQSGEDPFEAFFFAYMAVLAAAARYELAAKADDRHEGQLFRSYFMRNAEYSEALVAACYPSLRFFADRSAESTGAPVLEFMRRQKKVKYEEREEVLRDFAGHFRGEDRLSDERLLDAVGVLIYAIRNNLFHGDKDFNCHSDGVVLAHATPIMLRAIEIFEGMQ